MITARPRGSIRCFDLSVDGKRAAIAEGAVIRICDREHFVLKNVLLGHGARVTGLAWSPDGQRLASASEDQTARIWSTDGTTIAVLRGHRGAVSGIAWSRNGKLLATSSRDGTVRLWNPNGTAGAVLPAGHAPVTCVAISPDGARIASGDADRIVQIWSADGKRVARCAGHLGPIVALDWSPDGKLLASGCEGLASREGEQAERAILCLWDRDGKRLQSIDSHAEAFDCVRFSPDGSKVATTSNDFHLKIWTVAGELWSDNRADKEAALRWTPDGQQIVLASPDRILAIDVAPGTNTSSGRSDRAREEQARQRGVLIDKTKRFEKAIWNPKGEGFAALALDGQLRFFDSAGKSLRVVQTKASPGYRASLSWRPDGNEIVVSGFIKELPVFNRLGKELRHLNYQKECVFVAWSPDSKWVLGVPFGQEACLVPAEGGTERTFAGHRDRIEAIAWSPDGKRFATGSKDSTIRIWSVNGESIKTIEGFAGDVDSLSWSPDGEWIAAGLGDGSWRSWKADGTEGPTQSGHVETIMAIAHSPDSKRIATGGWDGTVRFWSAAGGEALHTAEQHVGPIMCVSWSPDGKRLLSASRDNTVRIWNTATYACEAVVLTMTDGTTATFAASGELIDGKPESLEKDVRYVVERPSGRVEMLTANEFLRLSKAGK
jgi:WD40 repeat protein